MIKPSDVAVMLYLFLHPHESFARMGAMLGISKSTAHDAVMRLERAGLVHVLVRGGAELAVGPALEFLQFGVPYVFVPDILPKARGVRTGLAAVGEWLESDAPDSLPTVWPSKLGESTGMGIKPLVAGAPDIALRDPRLYWLLALVDALRTGDVREREYARRAIRRALDTVDR